MESPAFFHVITAVDREDKTYDYIQTKVEGTATKEEIAEILNSKFGVNINIDELISTGDTCTYSYRFSYKFVNETKIQRLPIEEDSVFHLLMCIKYLLNAGNTFDTALRMTCGDNIPVDVRNKVWDFMIDKDFLYRAELLAYNK